MFEQLGGWAVDVGLDRAVLAENFVVRVHRPHLRHEDRGGLLQWWGLDTDHSLDRLDGPVWATIASSAGSDIGSVFLCK